MKLILEWSKEVTHVASCRSRPPPHRIVVKPPELGKLWNLLTEEQRQRALITLSGIVLRQVDAPRHEKEVRDECR